MNQEYIDWGPERELEIKQLNDILYFSLEQLPQRTAVIVKMIYGLGDYQKIGASKIAEELEVLGFNRIKKAYIYELHRQALRALRHPCHYKNLKQHYY